MFSVFTATSESIVKCAYNKRFSVLILLLTNCHLSKITHQRDVTLAFLCFYHSLNVLILYLSKFSKWQINLASA